MIILMKMNQKAFTLIEVVLVLAVGSLIFAMAFIAFSQASINRRDTQRRADLGKIAGEIENYAADNNGKYPDGSSFEVINTDFTAEYIGSLKDPGGELYSSIKDNDAPGHIVYLPEKEWGGNYKSGGTFCDGSELPLNNRDYVIRMKLEKGDVCRDSRQ